MKALQPNLQRLAVTVSFAISNIAGDETSGLAEANPKPVQKPGNP